jgi:hypothetical protein
LQPTTRDSRAGMSPGEWNGMTVAAEDVNLKPNIGKLLEETLSETVRAPTSNRSSYRLAEMFNFN